MEEFPGKGKIRGQSMILAWDKGDFAWTDKVEPLSARNIWVNAGISFISGASDAEFSES